MFISSSSSSCYSHGWSRPLLVFGLQVKSLQVRSSVDSQKTEYRKLLQWRSILLLKMFNVSDSTTSSGRPFHTLVAVFTAQCTLVQMRGLGIACRLSVCLSVCNVGGLWSHRLEIWETNCMDNYLNTFGLCGQKAIRLLPGEHDEILGDTRGGLGKKWRSGEQKRQYLWNA